VGLLGAVVFLDGVGGVGPGGDDEVAEFDGAGGEALFGEGFGFRRASVVEAAGFFELVGFFYEGVGLVEVLPVLGPLVVDDGGLGGGDEGGDVGGFDVGRDVDGFKLGVDLVFGGVAVGVGAGPAVVLDGVVEWLGAVADIVAEPAGVEEDGELDGGGVFMRGGEFAVLAEVRLEALPDFFDLPGLEADGLEGLNFRVLRKRGGEVADEVVAFAGEVVAVDAVRGSVFTGGRAVGGPLVVEEVVGRLGGDELGFGVALLPAVGLGAHPLDDVDAVGVAEEVGDFGGKILRGETVDEHVTVAAPGVGGGGGEDGEKRGGERYAGDRGEAHGESITRFGSKQVAPEVLHLSLPGKNQRCMLCRVASRSPLPC
jgi:hypothetical protein